MRHTDDMPLGALTIGEFRELVRETVSGPQVQKQPAKEASRRYVYGLRGIETLFGVSHKTAQHYKDHVINEAVYQNGRKIVVDADLAMELFRERTTT